MPTRSGDRSSPAERACWPRPGDPPITDAEWDGQRYGGPPLKGTRFYRPWWKPLEGHAGNPPSWTWYLVRGVTFRADTGKRLVVGDPMIPGKYIYGGTSLSVTVAPARWTLGIDITGWNRPWARRQNMGAATNALGVVVHLPMVEIVLRRGWYGP